MNSKDFRILQKDKDEAVAVVDRMTLVLVKGLRDYDFIPCYREIMCEGKSEQAAGLIVVAFKELPDLPLSFNDQHSTLSSHQHRGKSSTRKRL